MAGTGLRARASALLFLCLGTFFPWNPLGAQDEPEVFKSEILPGVVATVELASGGGFNESVLFQIYFLADRASSNARAPIGGPRGGEQMARVFLLTQDRASRAAYLERCHLKERQVLCRRLEEPADFVAHGDDGWSDILQVEVPRQGIDWREEFLRLTMAEGRYGLTGGTLGVVDGRDVVVEVMAEKESPPFDGVVLPALKRLEQQYLEQRPFFEFDVSPLVRNQRTGEGGFDELSVDFHGGIYRSSASGMSLFQLTWEGHVATADSIGFDRLSLGAGLARNLIPSDWLPLTMGALAEADQRFETVDLGASADLAFVLPFNLNLQSGAYRPAVAPLLKVLGAYGAAVRRPDLPARLPDEEEPPVPPSGEDGAFFRAGYDIQWRVPVGSNMVTRLHHAGLWNDPQGVDGAWHLLWDIVFEIEAGGVKYFVGYQKGEAAPTFEPIESTRLGLTFAVGTLGGGG